jgi:hypothetical protein
MDYDKFQPIEDMSEVTPIFKKIFDGGKSYGTDTIRMGFYKDFVLTAKVEGNKIFFCMPYYGPMAMLNEFLTHTHFNKTDSIMCVVEVNDDNTMLTATFYSKEFKLFKDL